MYIVTGATGFIGSNLLAEMQQRGYSDIVCCDTLGSGDKWKNIAKRGALQLIFPNQLQGFIAEHQSEIKAVLHLGAISSTTETNVDSIVENNFQLTLQLYTFCRAAGIPLIYASSAATYGAGERGFIDRDDPAFLASLRPLNPYGWSKNAVDKNISTHISTLRTSKPSQVVGLKFFNVYGPNEYHKGMQMSVVRHFFEQYRATGKVRLFKSYRDDCADGEQRQANQSRVGRDVLRLHIPGVPLVHKIHPLLLPEHRPEHKKENPDTQEYDQTNQHRNPSLQADVVRPKRRLRLADRLAADTVFSDCIIPVCTAKSNPLSAQNTGRLRNNQFVNVRTRAQQRNNRCALVFPSHAA